MEDSITDISFEPLDGKYIKLLKARIIAGYIALMGLAFVIPAFDLKHEWIILGATECVLAAAFAINLSFAGKIYRFRGYALNDRDITYRSGIIFTNLTTIPFSKIQQVSIRMNIFSRFFNLCYVDVINGSQSVMNQVTIPGLSKEKSERIKSLLISKTECADE